MVAGVAGLPRARDGEPQHGGADAAHLRRGAAADLHADAPRLLPALRELAAVQGAGAHVGRLPRARLPLQRPRAAPQVTVHSLDIL